jgi:hypothetical protein
VQGEERFVAKAVRVCVVDGGMAKPELTRVFQPSRTMGECVAKGRRLTINDFIAREGPTPSHPVRLKPVVFQPTGYYCTYPMIATVE